MTDKPAPLALQAIRTYDDKGEQAMLDFIAGNMDTRPSRATSANSLMVLSDHTAVQATDFIYKFLWVDEDVYQDNRVTIDRGPVRPATIPSNRHPKPRSRQERSDSFLKRTVPQRPKPDPATPFRTNLTQEMNSVLRSLQQPGPGLNPPREENNPPTLHTELRRAETAARVATEEWAPRTLDIQDLQDAAALLRRTNDWHDKRTLILNLYLQQHPNLPQSSGHTVANVFKIAGDMADIHKGLQPHTSRTRIAWLATYVALTGKLLHQAAEKAGQEFSIGQTFQALLDRLEGPE